MAESDDEIPPEDFIPSRSLLCSKSLADALISYRESFDSFMFLIQIVSHADKSRRIAKEALGHTDLDDDPEPAQKALKRFSRTNSENLTNNSVNAFQRFFSQIVQECIKKKPEILTSNETVQVKDIIHFTRMADVVELLVERRVNKLAYEGISGIENYFADRLGIQLFQDAEQRQLAREFIELRNIIVHNGGVVNAIFLERIGSNPTQSFVSNRRFHVGWDDFCKYSANMISVARRLDQEASKKFSLQRKKLGTWIKMAENS